MKQPAPIQQHTQKENENRGRQKRLEFKRQWHKPSKY